MTGWRRARLRWVHRSSPSSFNPPRAQVTSSAMGVNVKSKVADRLPLAKLHAELRGLKTLGAYVRVGFIGEGQRQEDRKSVV